MTVSHIKSCWFFTVSALNLFSSSHHRAVLRVLRWNFFIRYLFIIFPWSINPLLSLPIMKVSAIPYVLQALLYSALVSASPISSDARYKRNVKRWNQFQAVPALGGAAYCTCHSICCLFRRFPTHTSPVITNEPSGNFVVSADIGIDGKLVSVFLSTMPRSSGDIANLSRIFFFPDSPSSVVLGWQWSSWCD